MIDTNTDGCSPLFAHAQERHKAFPDFGQFTGVFFVGVLEGGKRFNRIHVVARVNAHLFHMQGGLIGGLGVEVDIGHQRHGAPLFQQSTLNQRQVGGLALTLGSQTHQIGTGIHDAQGLSYARLSIHGRGIGHGL